MFGHFSKSCMKELRAQELIFPKWLEQVKLYQSKQSRRGVRWRKIISQKFTGKHMCQRFFNTLYLKRDSNPGVFQWIFQNFYEHFSQEHHLIFTLKFVLNVFNVNNKYKNHGKCPIHRKMPAIKNDFQIKLQT